MRVPLVLSLGLVAFPLAAAAQGARRPSSPR